MAMLGSLKSAVFDREARKMQYRSHIRGLNAYDRHKKFMNDYVHFYGNAGNSDRTFLIKTDHDTIREGFRFIVSEDDDMESTWEKRLVKHYYDKLFKEYCIADMSQYKKGKDLQTKKVIGSGRMRDGLHMFDANVPWDFHAHQLPLLSRIGLRWRTEKEVILGKGQFICGNRHCDEKDGLGSYEVNFSYVEAGENKQALVKLVACNRCAEKLVYKRQRDKDKLLKNDQETIEGKRKKCEPDKNASTGEEFEESPDENKKARKMTARKMTSSRKDAGEDDDVDLDQFLDGMFP